MGVEKGTVYGVGVGPGDPELMTLKACRLIRETDVIAVSGETVQDSAAYRIAVRAVPELAQKEFIMIDMPMVRERCVLEDSHRKAADKIGKYLDEGRDVVYLTLGDPTIYCSFSYIRRLLEADGYHAETVSGVPSFCAAAAKLGESLADWDESLHIVPAAHGVQEVAARPGNYVLMKSGGRMREIKKMLSETGLKAQAVEKCGMEGERVYDSAEEIPDDAGYFTLVIIK